MANPLKRSALTLLAASMAAVSALISPGVQAEGKISIAQQFGIGYPRGAIETILAMGRESHTDPEIDVTVVPQRTFIYAEKLQQLGVLKNKADSWKDYFFEEAHGGAGS